MRPRCSPRAASRPVSAASKVRVGSRRCRPRGTTCRRSPRVSASTSISAATPTSRIPAASSTIRRSRAASSCITRTQLKPADIVAVRLRVAPLVLDLCNQQNITRGLQGKFSVYHGAAIGLVRGQAGLDEYTDAAVNDPAVKRVRERVTATGDPALTEDQAHIEVELADGRRRHLVRGAVARQHSSPAVGPAARRQVHALRRAGAARRRRRCRARSLLADR